MASGFITGGVDLDAKFKAGSGGAATGYLVGGVDLNARYAPRVTAPIAATGFLSGGVDLNNRFENIGGAAAQVQNGVYTRRAVGAATTASLQFDNSGNCNGSQNVTSLVFKYAWLVAGAIGDFEIMVAYRAGNPNAFSSGDAVGSFLPLSSTRIWQRSTVANNLTETWVTVTIRLIAAPATSWSGNVDVRADGTN